MKQLAIILFLSAVAFSATAQKDTVKVSRHSDTIRIGSITIIRKAKQGGDSTTLKENKKRQRNKNISTAYWVFDIGFANWNDNTDYAGATAGSFLVNRPGTPDIASNDFKLRSWKSSNVNIWFVIQRLNLIKRYVNLKYGIGLELNNYRFRNSTSFKEDGVNPYNSSQNITHAFIFRDSISFSKNKLAADYVTVPLMINFQTNPKNSNRGLAISAGISAGYLYSSRNKQVSDERGKRRNRGDYDLAKWKFSYIGEIGVGPVKLYGSYVPNSIFENGLSLMPYTIGIRFSNW
jgi:hypothetical protein